MTPQRPLLAVLTPIREAADELPEFLTAVEPLADAVVALDDGSRDGSWELLTASPLVSVALRNPRREGYHEWDDRANRQALLDAAAAVNPRWVLFLDVDERIEADDAAALREFLHTDALPGCAYGLQHLRTWGSRHDPAFTWIYRLFAWAPGLRLPAARLHFNPVPTSIPSERWIRTTIRVRHLGADSPARLAARLEKYAQADPGVAHGGPRHGGLAAPPAGELRVWSPREPALPLLAPADLEPPGGARDQFDVPRPLPVPGPERDGPELAVLVPVRDAARDLPGFLESAATLTDSVVALDDGSADGSMAALAASPLVHALIRTNRTSGRWDDARNRQMLLDAAGALRPRWVLFLDADERLDPAEATALRAFLRTDALPGFAYGLRVCRMIGDLQHFDRSELVVYRLFSWEPGQQLPSERLHLVPVPDSIPAERRLETTLRIQHTASITAERRRARHAKYLAEDARREFQRSYENLLAEPGEVRRWEPRPSGAPVLAGAPGPGGADISADLTGPALSAIVIARDDADRIEAALEAILQQVCPEPFEVIVVVSGSPLTAGLVRERFGERVKLVELEQPALPGAARNAGLRVARGEFVSFPGSHVEIAPGSLGARLRAHRAGATMVTGTIANGTDTPAGWASYFIDHADALPGRPSGELPGPPIHCSYMRHHLEQIGGFPEHLRAGEDTVVNQELFARGYRARRVQEIVLVHRSRCETVPRLLRHHFQRGRALHKIVRAQGLPLRRRLEAARNYLPARMRYIDGGIGLWGAELEDRYRAVRRLVRTGVLAALGGYLWELLTGSLSSTRP